ncbi:uncharacterized protein BHQ10_001295 [Talaromyces amestolkiae]|uniref:Hyaluronan/mRNA-binding protein domain-containing protein n=1 Tax=Talaromyces amestolkiae TaxID=1196081 RepID=A0A364KP10_TALAM|nr:uncharacterized protein BHQ10_001295 [Talaromyces amestolkiae]RAO65283.1 hypothetical protein BHQ10_001295 [Talaromyces amestolkiae]
MTQLIHKIETQSPVITRPIAPANLPCLVLRQSLNPITAFSKLNDQDHTSLADDPAGVVPRYFGKTGPFNADPNKTKKDGGGKGNWGRSGEEVQDYDYNFTNARRRSNSSNHGLSDFKTKFETVEPEPVFEEEFPDVNEKQGNGVIREVEADTDANGVSEA